MSKKRCLDFSTTNGESSKRSCHDHSSIINSAWFQTKIIGDIASLESALKLAQDTTLDMTRSFLEDTHWSAPLKRWVKLNDLLLNQSEHDIQHIKTLMRNVLKVLIDGGFFNRLAAFNFAISEVAKHGSIAQLDLLLEMCVGKKLKSCSCLKNTCNSLNDVLVNRSFDDNRVNRVIDLCTDAYLGDSFLLRDIIKGQDEPYSYLKTAVEWLRPGAVAALLKRLPQIPFDVCHSSFDLAEPVVLSLPKGELTQQSIEISAMLHVGEQFLQDYHLDLATALFSILDDYLPKELISVINLFAARMPLSKNLLKKIVKD